MKLPFAYQKQPRKSMEVRTGELEGLAPEDGQRAFPTDITYTPAEDSQAPATISEPSIQDEGKATPPAVDPSVLPANRATVPSTPTSTTTAAVASTPSPPPITIVRDSRGRPDRATGGVNAAARQQAEADAIDAYDPQKEPKWRRALRAAGLLGSMFGGAISRDSNTVAQAASGLGRTIANPKAVDEDWKKGKQAENLARRKNEATVANIEAQPSLRQQAINQRQQGIDIHGQRVADIRIKEALKDYNGRDYTPGENPSLDKYYEDSGLHELKPHKKDDVNQVVWDNGRLLVVGKNAGVARAVTEGEGGAPVVDEAKGATESITIGDQTFDHLTPREAATLAGRAYEGEQNRESRETISKDSQAGQDRRKAMGGSGRGNSGGINPSVKGAIVSLSKFRSLTAAIEKQKATFGNAKEGQPVIQSLYDQRDGLERDMKQLYGAYLEMDDKGKPKGLKEDAYTSNDRPTVDLTGQQRSVSQWRRQYPKATPAQESAWKTKVQAAHGTVIP